MPLKHVVLSKLFGNKWLLLRFSFSLIQYPLSPYRLHMSIVPEGIRDVFSGWCRAYNTRVFYHFKTHLSHFCSALHETQALSGKTAEFKLIVSRLEHEAFSSSTVPCYTDVKTLSSLPPFVSPAATGLRTHRWVTIVTVYYITAFYITCFLPVCPHSCCLKWAVKYYQIYIYFFVVKKNNGLSATPLQCCQVKTRAASLTQDDEA